MATAHSTQAAKAASNPFKRPRNIAIAAIAVIALLFWWNFSTIKGQAQLGAAYGAHVACSCRYIAGRDLKSCESDFEDGMGMVSVSDDPDKKRVTASVPFLAKAIAERRGAYGCVVLSEQEMKLDD